MKKPDDTNLTFAQLFELLKCVFALRNEEKALTILVDLPNEKLKDHPAWKDRREIATDWYIQLKSNRTPFSSVNLCIYENVGSNNADLPLEVSLIKGETIALSPSTGVRVSMHDLLQSTSVILALTELSATAPLKMLAKKYLFRGATLPGFLRNMIPALSLDYEKVNARVMEFKERLDRAEGAMIHLCSESKEYRVYLDLRFRTAHASGGLMREPGTVGNLPSGEAYIVPYEGENPNEPSKSSGILPVQFNGSIVAYKLEANRATSVLSEGPQSDAEQKKLLEEPAYGNIAELGIGVLGEWGIQPVGSTLLDEKLGLHIAFGRSEHFGGITSPAFFRDPKNVIHIDRVYIPSVQPMILVKEFSLVYGGDQKERIIDSGNYVI
jgi:hypothetical protein